MSIDNIICPTCGQVRSAAHCPGCNPMKIPSIGTYLTEDKQTAVVEELGVSLCSGRVEPDHPYVVWIRETGEALVPPFVKAPSLSIISPTPIPWRERILQLIETAHRDPAGSGRLISGDVTFHMDCRRVTVSRVSSKNVCHIVYLASPEIIGAFKARMTQLAAEAARAHDDSKAAAIEALLQ